MIGTTIAEIDATIEEELKGVDDDEARRFQLGLLQGSDPMTVGPRCLLSPTVSDMIRDESDVIVIYGPRREGKSVGAIAKCIYHAEQYPEAWPLTCAVVRDTHKNLTRSTVKTLKDGAKEGWWTVDFHDNDTVAILDGGKIHMDLFGMDRPADANKFQSYQADIVLIEEAAPAADMSSGVPIEVFAMGMSSLSSPKTRPIMILPMNPPDDDHWVVGLQDYMMAHGEGKLSMRTFWIPPGENTHVKEAYRIRMRIALEAAGRWDLVKRLVEGQVGAVQEGEAVTPEFVNAGGLGGHVPDKGVEMNARWLSYRFWDFGLNPTCVWAQVSPSGHFNVLGCEVGENMGIEQFIPAKVLTWQGRFGIKTDFNRGQATFGKTSKPAWQFRDIGDPAGSSREQSNSERSARKALETMLHTSFEPGAVEWSARRDSTKWVLRETRGRHKMAQFDREEAKPLIKALAGRWRYARLSSGKVSPIPIKDAHSHPGDAYGYGCAKLYPAHELLKKALDDRGDERPPLATRKGRGLSYLSK